MNTPSPSAPHLPDHVLEIVARRIQYTDVRGWIPWAWAILARSGEVPATIDEDEEDYPSHLITLAALAHLYEVFHEVLAGGDDTLETAIALHDEERPGLSAIEIARYCERNGVFDTQFPETAHGLAEQAIDDRTRTVHRILRNQVGVSRAFTALVIAGLRRTEEDDVPHADQPHETLDEESIDAAADDVLNVGTTENAARAFEWFRGDLDRR